MVIKTMDYEFYDDNEQMTNFYEYDEVNETETFWNSIELCLIPTFQGISGYLVNLLVLTLIFKISTQTVQLPRYLCHLSSLTCGIILLHSVVTSNILFILSIILSSYLLVIITKVFSPKYKGYITGVLCISFLFYCEFYLIEKNIWQQIRGICMIVCMKIISYAFDTDTSTKIPNPISYFGYLLCVGNCLFGPWISFKEYCNVYEVKKSNLSFKWFIKISLTVVYAVIFLSISNCWGYYLISDTNFRWFVAYRDALSFRASHYFIAYLSEAAMITSGFGYTENKLKEANWNNEVCRPFHIEIPRSLVQVVVFWDIPMHRWLKIYVFRACKPLGIFSAIFITYLVSSLLHAFNFQLAAILLSLGFYTYTEFKIRKKLCSIFNACILSNPCKRHCSHLYKSNNLFVKITNVSLGLLAMLHLAYLGVLVDSQSKTDFSLEKWQNLGFLSHWIILFSYLLYLLV